MRKPIRSLRALEEFQRALDVQFRNYRISRRPNLSDGIRRKLELRSAQNLNAVNLISRIHFARCLAGILEMHLSQKNVGAVFFVTLISEKHAVRIEDDEVYDIEAHKEWVASILAGLHYIGMIEPGYYPAASFIASGGKWISWHIHLLVWGITVAMLKKLESEINRTNKAFRREAKSFHFRRMKGIGDVAYICKSPRSEHYVYPRLKEQVDAETGEISTCPTGKWTQRKRQIRPGQFAILLNALQDKSIGSLCVAGGSGNGIVQASLVAARAKLKQSWQCKLAPGRSKLEDGRLPGGGLRSG